MSGPNICITSVGCRERYTPYLDRLEASLKKYAPNIPRLFFRDCWPPFSRDHQTAHYEFKAFAMDCVYKAGFNVGIWLDAQCEVLSDFQPILDRILDKGYYLTAGDEPLGEWISDQALDLFGVSRDEAMHLSLCGGAIVGIDFRQEPLGYPFLRQWKALSEGGYFYTSHSEFAPDKMTSLRISDGPDRVIHSKDPRFKGHRSDEACFSLMLHKRGYKPFSILEHFSGKIVKTGYDEIRNH